MYQRAPGMIAVACIVAGILCGSVGAEDPNLVAWWNFDDGPGPTAFDSSGNGNHGSLVGGVQWVPMETGGAMEFDGSSGYIASPSVKASESSTGAISL